MQVRWGIAVSSVVCWILVTRSCVSSREEPPAPYVTETNDGFSRSRLRSVSYRLLAAFSVFGGKNSNEHVLVAVRTKVTNSEAADQEQGYRLRVRMAKDPNADNQYKIDKLEQVTS